MAEEKIQYLNPLTLEAAMFLKELKSVTIQQMDEHLYDTLTAIVDAIRNFLSGDLKLIFGTEQTELVPPAEIQGILNRVYICKKCNRDVGANVHKAVVHLLTKHRANNEAEGAAANADAKVEEPKTARQLSRKQHKEQQRAKEIVQLPPKAKSLLNTDYNVFFETHIQVAEKLKVMPEYDTIKEELDEIITPLFPELSVKMYTFGSRLNGIGTRDSDLDIFVDIDKTFASFENRASTTTLSQLHKVYDEMKQLTDKWKHPLPITNARVPIVKVLNVTTGIECDIGFSNSLGYCNTKLMAYLFDLQPIARRLCMFLKKWLLRAKLNENLSTYSLLLMVVYFLQINGHLPAIELLQRDLQETVNVGPWIVNFMERSLEELNITKVECTVPQIKKLIKQFFELYADFNYATFLVCPYLGQAQIRIQQIKQCMPERYNDFINSTAENIKDGKLQWSKPMIVQDPIQLNHNVTKAITPRLLANISAYFKQSAEVLAANSK